MNNRTANNVAPRPPSACVTGAVNQTAPACIVSKHVTGVTARGAVYVCAALCACALVPSIALMLNANVHMLQSAPMLAVVPQPWAL